MKFGIVPVERRVYQWRLVVFKVREEGLRAWLPLACLFCWWHKYVRYKLFQGVFVNYSTK